MAQIVGVLANDPKWWRKAISNGIRHGLRGFAAVACSSKWCCGVKSSSVHSVLMEKSEFGDDVESGSSTVVSAVKISLHSSSV